MSSGNPFYHFTACNMCLFPVTHSTNILVSFCLQHHDPTTLSSCALPRSLPLSSYEPSPCLCTCLWEGQWRQSHKTTDTYEFPVKRPAIFPRTPSLAKGLASVGQLATLSPAPALPKVWPRETDPSKRSVRESSSITETRVQTNVVFLELLQLICLIMSGVPHAC